MSKSVSIYFDDDNMEWLDAEALRTKQSRSQIVAKGLKCLRHRERESLREMLLEELDKHKAEIYAYVDEKIAEVSSPPPPEITE
jgi:hypothetical protein